MKSIDLLPERRGTGFILGVIAAWSIMLGLILFVFSGWEINAGLIHIRTIRLDKVFIREYGPFIFEGVGLTMVLSLASILIASVLALLGALGRISRFPPAFAVATFYISIIRGTPLLLQILFFFLALPQLGVRLSGLGAGILALGLNYGAYMTEDMRAGIQAVSAGQTEAALALGMTPNQVMRYITLPQAFRIVVPAMGNQFISMLKDTALISTTGFAWEILWRAEKVGRANFRSLEALLVAAAFYWILTILFSGVQSHLETTLSRGQTSADRAL